MAQQFTETERAILRIVQADLPDSLTPYADIARTMGVVGDTTAELVEGLRAKIRSMNDAMGIPNTLKDFGIIEDEFKEKLDAIAANAVGAACSGSNPRPIDPATMAKLFTCIYYGTEVDF